MSQLAQVVRLKRSVPPPAEARRIMDAAGVSERDLAREIGVACTTIHRYLHGHPQRLRTAAGLARVLEELRQIVDAPDS